MIHSDNYILFSQDIRDTKGLTSKFTEDFNIPTNVPTMVLSECLLIYLKNEDSDNILKWLASNFNSSAYLCILNYEMIKPFDAFGQTMVNNLRERGCDLLGIEGCPTEQAQIDRINNTWEGKTLKVDCLTMDKVYLNTLDT
jgi:hypothetical protein